MKLDDFDFSLPEALIATRPASPRSSARLLVAQGDRLQDLHVHDLPQVLRAGDLLVLNNTRVIAARLVGQRRRGGDQARVEVTLLEPVRQGRPGVWLALARPLRKLAVGDRIDFAEGFSAQVAARSATDLHLAFTLGAAALDAAIEQAGLMPLPPYIASKRPSDAQDRLDYQSVFASRKGAVAAPTASLHFDAPLMRRLAERGVGFAEVTLHVGAGTFLPVKVDDISAHKMHAEWGEITPQVAAQINAAKAEGRRVIAVGTTALRLIEAAARSGQVRPWQGPTDIFIYPGFEFAVTSALMTNFHLPKSTLLMLVAALMGKARMDLVYAHAIAERYRFFSYGDASLLFPPVAAATPGGKGLMEPAEKAARRADAAAPRAVPGGLASGPSKRTGQC